MFYEDELWDEEPFEEDFEHHHEHEIDHEHDETATPIEPIDIEEILAQEELLEEEDKQFLRQKFESEMVDPVKVVLIKSENCPYCDLTEKLLNEIAPLAGGKIILEIRTIDEFNKEELGVDRGPIILIGDHGEVRYTGAPLGEEGWAFIETIVIASNRNHGFEDWEGELSQLNKKVRIETYVTPSCPYCPYAVLNANRIALASKGRVISDTVEAYEFPHLADKYNVTAVPTIILSLEKPYTGDVFSVGMPSEQKLLQAVINLAKEE